MRLVSIRELKPLAEAIARASFFKPIFFIIKPVGEGHRLFVQGIEVEDHLELARKLSGNGIRRLSFRRVAPQKISDFLSAVIKGREISSYITRRESLGAQVVQAANARSLAAEKALEIYKGLFPAPSVLDQQVRILVSLGRHEEAMVCLMRGLDMYPESTTPLKKLAVIGKRMVGAYYSKKMFAKALGITQDFLQRDKKCLWALYRQAECLEKLKRYDEAVASFMEVVSLADSAEDPTSSRVHSLNGLAYCYTERGRGALREGNKERAEEYFNHALHAFERGLEEGGEEIRTPRSYYGLGFLYIELARLTLEKKPCLDLATTNFNKALELDPDNKKAREGLNKVKKVFWTAEELRRLSKP